MKGNREGKLKPIVENHVFHNAGRILWNKYIYYFTEKPDNDFPIKKTM